DEPGLEVQQPAAQRSLILAELVGELRSAVCDPDTAPARQERAARSLARLARAGVPGAHPRQWYGLAEVSTDQPLRAQDEVNRVSPSTFDILTRCPLRILIARNGGSDPVPLPVVTGTLMHMVDREAAAGADTEQLRAELDRVLAKVDAGAPWF